MATTTSTIKDLRKNRREIESLFGDVHKEVVTFSEDAVLATIKAGEKWQKLMAKAIENSAPLVDKQIDIVFTVLEGFRGQYQYGSKRLQKLMSGQAKASQPKPAPKKQMTVAKKPVAKRVVKKRPVENDLTIITGIGQKMEEILKAGGIKTYEALANASMTELKSILETAGSRFKLFDPAPWKAQAKTLLKKRA